MPIQIIVNIFTRGSRIRKINDQSLPQSFNLLKTVVIDNQVVGIESKKPISTNVELSEFNISLSVIVKNTHTSIRYQYSL